MHGGIWVSPLEQMHGFSWVSPLCNLSWISPPDKLHDSIFRQGLFGEDLDFTPRQIARLYFLPVFFFKHKLQGFIFLLGISPLDRLHGFIFCRGFVYTNVIKYWKSAWKARKSFDSRGNSREINRIEAKSPVKINLENIEERLEKGSRGFAFALRESGAGARSLVQVNSNNNNKPKNTISNKQRNKNSPPPHTHTHTHTHTHQTSMVLGRLGS